MSVGIAAFGIEDRHETLASGVNTAIARTAGVVAIAALPAISSFDLDIPVPELLDAFRTAMFVSAAATALAGIINDEPDAPAGRKLNNQPPRPLCPCRPRSSHACPVPTRQKWPPKRRWDAMEGDGDDRRTPSTATFAVVVIAC